MQVEQPFLDCLMTMRVRFGGGGAGVGGSDILAAAASARMDGSAAASSVFAAETEVHDDGELYVEVKNLAPPPAND